MSVLWFQGPDGPPFPFQRGQGIHIPRLARKLKLEPSPLELNGVVVDYDSSTGYMFTAEFLDGRGTTQESAIRVTGEPAAPAAAAAPGGPKMRTAMDDITAVYCAAVRVLTKGALGSDHEHVKAH
jgi:hypothetical protein